METIFQIQFSVYNLILQFSDCTVSEIRKYAERAVILKMNTPHECFHRYSVMK